MFANLKKLKKTYYFIENKTLNSIKIIILAN
jgi:hypothetical protein